MFGKLLKYDFKALLKIHLGLYAILTVMALVTMGAEIFREHYPQNMFFVFVSPILICLFIVAGIAVVVISFILCIMRYRKNILKDEGYLTHTLPVESWKIHISKLLSSCVYMYLTFLVLYLLISIVVRDISWGIDIYNMINEEMIVMGMDTMMKILLITYLIAPISIFSTVFGCLCLGYKMNGHKDAMSFVMYIAYYVINQALGLIVIFVVSFAEFGNIFAVNYVATEPPVKYFNMIMISSVGILIAWIVVYNLISVRVLNRRLNLE